MKFILIYWLLANASGYAPTGTALFDDQAACENALRAIGDTWANAGPPGVCVPQGSAVTPAPAPSTPAAPTQPASPAAPAPALQPTVPGGKTCPAGSPRPTC